ncbi:MAG: AAA family ATPase [Armatimonadetes bacterium]|nr:AAA family ATPase [Armatimonadota bacterium]NIM23550.1 AAA family ATPase [Armatimonadota bacterium]NIM67416.1 AAA family ATPase [Armatimonadota bacterium]NIM75917.1 AAA family ATPase [Armatimonadota bacterium]NIN05602.1 AAA family ATPase [Armatimonadota bacterium]
MLIEFSVKNYLSFKDKATLSLVASADPTHLENTFSSDGTLKGLSLLKSVGIYGPNASGKSNLIKAISFMREFVLTPFGEQQQRKAINVTPFKLNPKTTAEPSEFEVVFAAAGQRYAYGFSADKGAIHEEWLTAARHRTRRLFYRHDNDVEFGSSWKGERQKLKDLLHPKALVLSSAIGLKNKTAEPVHDWFEDGLKGISNRPEESSEMSYTLKMLAGDRQTSEYFQKFLKIADLGIERVEAERVPLTSDEIQRRIAGLPAEIIRMMPAEQPEELEEINIKSFHKKSDGSEIAFNFEEESAGTQRFLAVAGPLLYVLARGCTLIVDELDSHFHPFMTKKLVELFHLKSLDTNPQLIFTTHDVTLLDSKIMRRDQLWLTEKDRTGATQLYPLSDIRSIRKNEDFRARYLEGRYGAIPLLEEMRFEEEEE